MGSVLNGLVKLQSIEYRLRAVKAKLAKCKRNVAIQENKLRSLQNSLEAKKEEVNLTRIESDRLEVELKSSDETIAKLRASLNAAKTNKEYASVLTMLNTTKADSSKVEEQILNLMKEIEDQQAECHQIQEQINQQQQELESTRKQSETEAKEYETQIKNIQDKWDQATGNIPREALKIFKRVAETYDGEALAEVEQQQGKKGSFTCGGCFMEVPMEMVNLLMTKDDIIRCPNCTRILVLREDSKQLNSSEES